MSQLGVDKSDTVVLYHIIIYTILNSRKWSKFDYSPEDYGSLIKNVFAPKCVKFYFKTTKSPISCNYGIVKPHLTINNGVASPGLIHNI